VLRLPDAWLWDFWLAQDCATYHLFFLRASRALGDPNRRHRRASIGHAVSTDLRRWTLVADALVASDPPAFDDIATWTGSVIRAPDGRWRMFYTGVDRAGDGLVQRIGQAESGDLMTWHRLPDVPILRADPRWYELSGDPGSFGEAWRDPWVFPDPGGDHWHMLVTARAKGGAPDDRGVIGYALSADLRQWEAQPPLTSPGSGFGHLEVPQVEIVDRRAVLLFSCLHDELALRRRRTGATGGVWAVTGESLLGPYDPAAAQPITDDSLYSGRLVRGPDGAWNLLAFRNHDRDGHFIGELSDPMPVSFTADAVLTVAGSRLAS
jgi:beta-fructofuranosidase